jgi:predicted RNA-binding Zn ribbon-like protein
MSDGSWQRVKACRADDCHWAFYDFSRNRSGTWCDMAVCGNREKVRSYRERAPRGEERDAARAP